ncbi:hypothetical protein V9T40_009424 [Parthenolecanium corni]|uniref:BZIP domain-containing protein n=1 Tax=Parthenolecanium corni TaxID=536013 RepID=A0AAN9Y6Q4_9HEMI
MGDFNLLNIFFDADNFLLKSNENDFSFKEIHGTEEEPAEWFTEDTLNQMLPLLDQFFCNSDDNIRNFALDECSFDESSESDKSASSDDSCDVDEFYYIGRNEIVSDYTTEKVKIVYPKHRHECLESVISSPSKKIKFSKKLDSKISSGKKKQCTNDVKSSQPRLQLTSEEKKIALIEGIELPTHYPLTKEQERQLKRIRRKIRNKISAQNSRRRKQEYVDSLEQKLKRTSEENARLMKRIKSLESEKSTLTTKVSQLQAAVARGSGQTVQPTSCLLVLIMSLALILAPSLKNSSLMDENFNDKDTSMFDGQSSALLNSGKRIFSCLKST